jgi:23S rRNA (cytidine2498-2'-O)-methyltransferase
MSENGAVFIGTSNHGFAQQAQEEIRRLFGGAVKYQWLVPGEVFLARLEEASWEETVRVVTESEPVFLRHLHPVNGQEAWNGSLESLVEALREKLVRHSAIAAGGERVAVQVRKTEHAAPGVSPSSVKHGLDEVLTVKPGIVPVVREAEWIISLFLTEDLIYWGISRPSDNLSDWPGGAVRYRKEEGQVSRAKFKLLEAEQTFGLDFTQYRAALDVGAAPGGWTSLLLERGLDVTAIDPAKLDPGVLKHPKLTYYQKNAGDVKLKPDSFDLLVCDMSWSPRQMVKLIQGLLYSLKPGGTAIITLKLMHGKALQSLREATEDFEPQLSLQKAKQLFHNREELTLFLVKNG